MRDRGMRDREMRGRGRMDKEMKCRGMRGLGIESQ